MDKKDKLFAIVLSSAALVVLVIVIVVYNMNRVSDMDTLDVVPPPVPSNGDIDLLDQVHPPGQGDTVEPGADQGDQFNQGDIDAPRENRPISSDSDKYKELIESTTAQ